MNALGLAAIAAFFAAFAASTLLGFDAAGMTAFHFEAGQPVSYANAVSFSFIFSLLLFGYSAPAAMAIEGARYAQLASGPWFEMLFAVPELLAAYSAVLLGQGILLDLQGKGNIFVQWHQARKFLLAAVGSLAILMAVRLFI